MSNRGQTFAVSEDTWTNDQRAVYERLKLYGVIDDLDCIPLDAFTLVVGTITTFKMHPITPGGMAKVTALSKQQLARREILDRAAEILADEIERGNWRNFPALAGHVRQHEAAIAILRTPRGVHELPNSWQRAAKQGDPVRPSTYMAVEIAGWVVWALRSRRVEPRNAAGLARFIRDALAFIGVNDLPNEREILEVLQKHALNRDTR
jgi:hypothetical protein